MSKKHGYFVVSLDFELFWGMADKYTLEQYGPNVAGERTAIPRMLTLFLKYGIHATWATLGLLMARNRDELLSLLPPQDLRPHYDDPLMSSYHHLEHTQLGRDESDDPYHYGSSLVELIQKTPHQEIGNHTFSHYYVIDGNDSNTLSIDLDIHAKISKTYGIKTTSIVFPRNQFDAQTLTVLEQKGIAAYRGNEKHFLYQPRKDKKQTLIVRGLRLLDHYFNISGHHTYSLPRKHGSKPIDLPASRFFRPYMPLLSILEPLRLRRIKKSMTHAAKRGEVFHLWWHPHNVGIHQEENFRNLESLLLHFKKLQNEYGMESASMEELVTICDEQTASTT